MTSKRDILLPPSRISLDIYHLERELADYEAEVRALEVWLGDLVGFGFKVQAGTERPIGSLVTQWGDVPPRSKVPYVKTIRGWLCLIPDPFSFALRTDAWADIQISRTRLLYDPRLFHG